MFWSHLSVIPGCRAWELWSPRREDEIYIFFTQAGWLILRRSWKHKVKSCACVISAVVLPMLLTHLRHISKLKHYVTKTATNVGRLGRVKKTKTTKLSASSKSLVHTQYDDYSVGHRTLVQHSLSSSIKHRKEYESTSSVTMCPWIQESPVFQHPKAAWCNILSFFFLFALILTLVISFLKPHIY